MRKIVPLIKDRSRHIRLNKSKILSSEKSTDPLRFNCSQESIRKILQQKSSPNRDLIFQRRNHSVIEYMPARFNITEVGNTDQSQKISPR